jgi:hypothetical protein
MCASGVDGEEMMVPGSRSILRGIFIIEAAQPVRRVEKFPSALICISAPAFLKPGGLIEISWSLGQTSLRRVPGKGDQGASHLVELITKLTRGIEEKPAWTAAWLDRRKRRIERGKRARPGVEVIDEHLIDP